MGETADSATARYGKLFRTDDARIATAYQCFVWSLLLRASWLAVDMGLVPLDERVLVLMFTLVAVPLADLLGCGATITRLRETRLVVMALAVALFWSRGLLWPQACSPSWPPYGAMEAAPRLCQGIANGACVVTITAACLDKSLLAVRLSRRMRMVALSLAFVWMAIAIAAGFPGEAQSPPPIRILAGLVLYGLAAILAVLVIAAAVSRRMD